MICKFWQKKGVSRQDLTESHKQTARKREREQTQVQPLCPARSVKKSKVSVPVSPWCSVLSAERPKSSKTELALPLVVRFGRSAAQILQNGLRSPAAVPF